ncbi:GatB/YqeY domain-containing protein [Actinoalloteichus spitiensis]|uniref:GatB/YqeY domain-containing protein n=1 Tax=Actinoalloteichus spitiensis TaxID=252394 RepID=UPI000369525F|nr:GatB/YqeY domain-containing protein [Actinoalloteichus spitiensis]
MRSTLRDALSTALKARDRVAIAALRSALAAIDNAGAVPLPPSTSGPGVAPGAAATSEHVAGTTAGPGSTEVDRRQLTVAEEREIVEDEARERREAAAAYEHGGRHEHAERLRAEAEVLHHHLSANG